MTDQPESAPVAVKNPAFGLEIAAAALGAAALVMFFVGPYVFLCVVPAIAALIIAVVARKKALAAGSKPGYLGLIGFLLALFVVVMRLPPLLMRLPGLF